MKAKQNQAIKEVPLKCSCGATYRETDNFCQYCGKQLKKKIILLSYSREVQ